ncbi:MAG: polysaccharide biosynthesis C-terminal domain-containing protein [Thermoleophilia bacterium]
MSRESFKQTLGHGLLSFGAVALIGLVGSVIIARVYGVDVIGEYAITLAPVGVLTYISTVQEQAALIRALSVLEARDPRVTGLTAAVFGFSSLMTIMIGGVVGLASAFVLAGPMDHPGLIRAMAVQILGYVLITNTCWNIDSVLNAFRSGRQLLWVRLTQASAFLVIAVVYGLVDPTVWGLVWATIGSWALSLLPRIRALGRVMLWRVPAEEIREGVRALPEMIRFGLKAAPGGVVVGVNAEAGTWILGFTSNLAAVGAWNRARQLGDRLKEGTIRLNEALLPTLVERRNQGDDEGHDRAWADSVRYGLAGMLLVASVGGGAGEGVMNIFGPGFSQGATALALILVYQALQAVDSMHITALYAANRPWLTTVASTVGMVVGLAVAIPMSMVEGVTGPAIGLVLGIFSSTCVMHGSVRRMLSTPLSELWPPRQMFSIAVGYAAGFLTAYAVDQSLGGHLGTLAALAAGTVAYVIGFVLPGGLGERDRDRIRSIRERIAARGAATA